MARRVDINLLRLRSATSAYMAILRDVAPEVEMIAATDEPLEDILTGRAPLHDLADSVRTAMTGRDAVGTPFHIAHRVAVALGEA